LVLVIIRDQGLRGKTIIASIPKMLSIAVLKLQNLKKLRDEVRINSKKFTVVIQLIVDKMNK
jgi:hypothetical protein